MKVREIMEDANLKGSYAGTYFDSDTVEAIRKYITENNIPNPVNVNKLHTTLLYSRKYLPDYKAQGEITPPYVGTPTELDVWDTQPKEGQKQAKCLVMKYDCPELVERHLQLMKEHGATFDYETYNPHITLSYDIGDLDVSSLPDITEAIKQIVVSTEYGEDLDLDWASSAHK